MSAHFSEKIKMRAKSISVLLIWRLLNGPQETSLGSLLVGGDKGKGLTRMSQGFRSVTYGVKPDSVLTAALEPRRSNRESIEVGTLGEATIAK